MALTIVSARALGFWWSFFASSKHSDEESCPNSMFGGLFNGKVSIFTSGRAVSSAWASVVSHSLRNWAKGFSEIMWCFAPFSQVSAKSLRVKLYFNLERRLSMYGCNGL